jgi:hypothetical protein
VAQVYLTLYLDLPLLTRAVEAEVPGPEETLFLEALVAEAKELVEITKDNQPLELMALAVAVAETTTLETLNQVDPES